MACLDRWTDLSDHLNHWFYKPDLEALECCLSAAVAHYESCDPVWLFILGPSGSGKTSVLVTCLSALPGSTILGDLTPKTFLSGSGQGEKSLLFQVQRPMFLFKDFTTIMSKRDEDKREIASQLREVFDGHFVKNTGNGKPLEWKGKATVFAAATPALERAWAIHRELGERFMQVRWAKSNSLAIAAAARRQIGHESEIRATMLKLTHEFFMGTPPMTRPLPHITDVMELCIDRLAACVAMLRSQVIRDSHGSRDILSAAQTEEPTRIAKALTTLARCHSALFRRDEVDYSDYLIARRVALDSIPQTRSQIMQALPAEGSIALTDLAKFSGAIRATVEWNLDEMEALGIMEFDRDPMNPLQHQWKLTDSFHSLWSPSELT
jgi:hypothetical protein